MGAGATDLSKPVALDIAEDDLDAALNAFANQGDLQILFSSSAVRGKRAAALRGTYLPADALTALLQGSGLDYRIKGDLIVISPQATRDLQNPAETIIVTGFRNSIEKALAIKHAALDASDTILAEDVVKFPDLNVSESLQRIPGVALNRSGGEGNEVSVRGLGPDFTRVRINGVEALATAGSSSTASTNRGRAFDFNVFASDLFSSLTIHKSNSSEIEEGSLGATIDMYTGRPLDQPGRVLAASLRYGTNDLSGATNPRLAVLASDKFLGGRLGILVSGAYGIRNLTEDGWSTVRWTNDNTPAMATHAAPGIAGCVVPCSVGQRFHSVLGETSGPVFDAVNEAFHPRFPRYDLVTNHQKRLGLTAAVQYQRDDVTNVTLDILFADYDITRHEYYLEANALSTNYAVQSLGEGLPPSYGIRAIDVTRYSLDAAKNTVTAMTADHVGLRTENFLAHIDSRFEQITLDATQKLTSKVRLHALLGWSESHMRNPLQTTLTYDYGGSAGATGGMGYSYNFSGGYDRAPALRYGSAADAAGNVTSPSGWFLSQIRERADYNFNSYRNAIADLTYDWADALTLKLGFDFKSYGYRTSQRQRSNGTTAALDYTIPAALRAAELSGLSKVVSLRGLRIPAGSATTWFVPDLEKWNQTYDIWSPTAQNGAFRMDIEPSLDSNGAVHENDLGIWLQADWNLTLFRLPARGNIGARLVRTRSESIGYSYDAAAAAVIPADVRQSYYDILPALNAVVDVTDDVAFRFNAAFAMSRPSLTNMLPDGSVTVSGANRSVSVGNPFLKPYRSKDLDVALEWYPGEGTLLSIAGFYKHIDTLVQRLTQNATYQGNSFGLPNNLVVAACGSAYAVPPATGCNENAIWLFTSYVNTKGRPLYGTEIDLQQPLDFLPAPFDNFGVLTNATLVQAEQDYFNTDGSISTHADLTGLSRISYNATLYYDDGALGARLSAAYRSKYVLSINPGNNNDQLITAPTFNLDWSSSYRMAEHFTATFEAVNLTNQALNEYVDTVGLRGFNWHQTGREYYFGIRCNY